MQGRNPYQGQAVSNMDFPTEAYVQAHGQAYGRLGDAYAQAAAMEAQGKQQMVEGLGKGLMGAFGEFKANREAEKNFSAGKSMLESPYFQKILGMSSEDAADYGSFLDKIKKEQGVDAANKAMDSSLGSIIKYAQSQQGYSQQTGLIGARLAAENQAAALSQYLKLFGTPSATPPATVNPPPQAVPTPAAMPPAQAQGTVLSPGNVVLPGETKASPWSTFKSGSMGF